MKKFFSIFCVFSILVFLFCNKFTYAKENTYFYVYDKNNRITTILEKGEPIIDFLYDKNGNFLGKRLLKEDQPTKLNLIRTENGIKLSWNAVLNAKYYTIYQLEYFNNSRSEYNFKEIGRTSDLNFDLNFVREKKLMALANNLQEFYVTAFIDKESIPSESVVYDPTDVSKFIYEANDTKETAYPITTGSYTAYIQDLGDLDYYEIKLPSGMDNKLRVKFTGTGDIGFSYRIFSETQGVLTELPNISVTNTYDVYTYDAARKYYIKVFALNKASTKYPYKIDINNFIINVDEPCEICLPPVDPPAI